MVSIARMFQADRLMALEAQLVIPSDKLIIGSIQAQTEK